MVFRYYSENSINGKGEFHNGIELKVNHFDRYPPHASHTPGLICIFRIALLFIIWFSFGTMLQLILHQTFLKPAVEIHAEVLGVVWNWFPFKLYWFSGRVRTVLPRYLIQYLYKQSIIRPSHIWEIHPRLYEIFQEFRFSAKIRFMCLNIDKR